MPGSRAELAMLGRSNVGKSSLINALTHRKSLAKTSKAPGATRLLNIYELDPDALELPMDELDRLRAGGRMVGLISHVGALRERIRFGIEVQPGNGGSRLRVGELHA